MGEGRAGPGRAGEEISLSDEEEGGLGGISYGGSEEGTWNWVIFPINVRTQIELIRKVPSYNYVLQAQTSTFVWCDRRHKRWIKVANE